MMRGLDGRCSRWLPRRGTVAAALASAGLAVMVALTAVALLAPAGTQAQDADATESVQTANTMAITEITVAVTGTETTQGYVTLDWEAPAGASDDTVYRMYWDDGKRGDIYVGGPARTPADTFVRHNFFLATPGAWRTYWVLAEHSDGAYDPPSWVKGNRGTLSGPYHIQIPEAGPSVPTNPTAVVNADGYVELSWGKPTTNAEGSRLHYHIRRVGRAQTIRTPYSPPQNSAGTSWTDTSVVAGGKYTYRIEAHDGYDVSDAAKVKVSIPSGVPFAPRNMTARDNTASSGEAAATTTKSVRLTWDVPSWDGGKDLRHYQVRRENTKGKGKNLGTIAAGEVTTVYVDDTARANRTYIYKVRAKNKHGYGEWTTVRFRTPR